MAMTEHILIYLFEDYLLIKKKDLRLTPIGEESFLFRILFIDKRLNLTTPDMLYGVK